ncbi:MAG: hypothetical protein JNM84_10005, partial [Planctomycetes bacterium]|nr:hypothetical protein [Planctomycetota bacterium]
TWHTYATLELGTFAAGDVADAVRLTAKRIPGEGALNLRALILRPAS